ncbi:glycosyltransferase [Mucilaginibacter koreensis]
MKKLLIISPYFSPVNAADMQRVRMSLPYFAQNGWQAEVVMVDAAYADIPQDDLLLQSLPEGAVIHKVKALNKSVTSKFGLGSIALRSLLYYKSTVNKLLRKQQYHLIYFSTTQFPVCILGAYWKKKFGIPYVIDMQDPWHSEYYQDKPKHQRPPKYWFSYRINKLMEPIAMNKADGLISVSPDYITDLQERYPATRNVPSAVIPFGAFYRDMEIANYNRNKFERLLNPDHINVVYIGRGGTDMHKAIAPVFSALKQGLHDNPQRYRKIKFYFIGTSYAAATQGKPSISPLAEQYGVEKHVTEITDRISFYHSLITLQQADALFIPGSDDPKYTASKLYPYLLTQKPLLTIFNPASPAMKILAEYGVKHAYSYDQISMVDVFKFFEAVTGHQASQPEYNVDAIHKYSAQQLTRLQCELLGLVTDGET